MIVSQIDNASPAFAEPWEAARTRIWRARGVAGCPSRNVMVFQKGTAIANDQTVSVATKPMRDVRSE